MFAIGESFRKITKIAQRLSQRMREQGGAELVEFAISLPLLVVFVVGIYDFGSAFTLKQKLGNITLEAARIAASQPMDDLSNTGACGAPASVCEIRDIVASDLGQNHVINCGLSTASGIPSPSSPLTWTFTAGAGCPDNLVLNINRGFNISGVALQSPFTSNYTIEATQVTLTYPYQWQFNRVIGLLVPSANYPGNSSFILKAVMQNLN